MILNVFIGTILVLLGSYISFFEPKILSNNIEPLSSKKIKWFALLGTILINGVVIWFLNPKTVPEWIDYLFLVILFFISIIDSYSKIIPNRLVVSLFFLSIFNVVLAYDIDLIMASVTLFFGLSIVNLIASYLLEKQVLGWGDVKLIGVLGLFMGWEILWVTYIAIIIAGLLSIVGILANKITGKTKIPFAAFLHLGYIIIHYDLAKSFL